MRSIDELNPHKFPTTHVIDSNLAILYQRIMELQDACEMEFTITSGLRSDLMQNELIKQGKTNAKHSKHCVGLAADIYDPEKKLQTWVMANLQVCIRVGLWFESFDYCSNWVHAQATPPASGNRIFIP